MTSIGDTYNSYLWVTTGKLTPSVSINKNEPFTQIIPTSSSLVYIVIKITGWTLCFINIKSKVLIVYPEGRMEKL